MEHLDHWTDAIVKYWYVFAIAFGVAILVEAVRRTLRNRPRANTSAMQRLIARNPALMFDGARWTVAAQRVRVSWVTSLAVAVAVLIAADRPMRSADN